MVRKLMSSVLLWLLSGMVLVAQAATISTSVDRQQIQVNESFNLEFRSDSDVDDDPNFAQLEKDFDIINRSQSSNIQIMNGHMDREITWNLTLIPKHTGQLQIPAIAFGSDKSNPVTVNVVEAKRGSSALGDTLVYLEAFVDTNTVYVQSQVNYTLRIYHAAQLRNASLGEVEISDKDAVVEKITENNRYEKYINGVRYRVFEKHYAIFPQNVGELFIEPVTLDAQYIELPRALRTKRVSSDRIKIKVLPVPAEIANKNLSYWLPAKSLTLTEEWSDQQGEVKVGEPVTRTLTLQASGLMASQLPVISDNAPNARLKQYADQPVLENNVVNNDYLGTRQEKIAYIPVEPGQVKIPGVQITWWNTKTNKLQTASLPPRTVKVVGAPVSQTLPPSAAQTGDQGSEDVATSGQRPEEPVQPVAVGGIATPVWFWLSVTFMVLWLATLAMWFRSKRTNAIHDSGNLDDASRHANRSAALKQVKIACEQQDPQQTKNALIEWGRAQWPDAPPTSLGHIAQMVNGSLTQELTNLNTVLYKSPNSQWNGASLWQALDTYVAQQQKQGSQSASAIKPLFRLANDLN